MRDTLEAARSALAAASAVVPHTDADGLAAGAIALRSRGEGADAAVLLSRGQTPWAAPLPEGLPAILDWGMRELDRPALIVDHHLPDAAPRPGQILVSGHGEEPETSTAPIMRRIAPEQPAWLAALGAVGDLGAAGFGLPECAGAPRGAVRRLVSLVNAPRRLPDGPVREALAILVENPDPAAALADPRIAALESAKATWRAEFERVVRTAPRVLDRVAVIRFSSPCQVHPLVATAWARRLAPRPVMAANDGYLPGRVNFSVRGPGDLIALLRDAMPETTSTEFARGHPGATGGSLTPEDFERLLGALA